MRFRELLLVNTRRFGESGMLKENMEPLYPLPKPCPKHLSETKEGLMVEETIGETKEATVQQKKGLR